MQEPINKSLDAGSRVSNLKSYCMGSAPWDAYTLSAWCLYQRSSYLGHLTSHHVVACSFYKSSGTFFQFLKCAKLINTSSFCNGFLCLKLPSALCVARNIVGAQ